MFPCEGKKKKNLKWYKVSDLSLVSLFPLLPKQGIVIYLNGEFGRENQTCSPQFFLSSFSVPATEKTNTGVISLSP